MLLPLKMANRRLNTEKKLFWNGVTDVLHQATTNEVKKGFAPYNGHWPIRMHCCVNLGHLAPVHSDSHAHSFQFRSST